MRVHLWCVLCEIRPTPLFTYYPDHLSCLAMPCLRPLAAEARVRSKIRPYGICGGCSGAETGFSPSTSVFPVIVFLPMLLTHLPEGQTGEVWVPFKQLENTGQKSKAVRRRLLVAVAWFRASACHCGICGRWSGIGRGISLSISVVCQYPFTAPPRTHLHLQSHS
jgi:hypothetical protein